MDIRVIGVTAGIIYIFGWFMPMGYFNVGSAFGDFFTAFSNGSSSQMNNVASNMQSMSSEMFGNTYAVINGQTIGSFSYLMLVAGAAFAFFAWTRNRTLLLVTAVVMVVLPLFIYFSYIDESAWGLYLIFGAAISSCVYAYFSENDISS